MSDTASFLDATPAETAEFEAVRDEKPVPEAPEPAPPAEPTKAAETPAEPPKAEEPAKPAEPAKPDERPKFVPHAALHEERLKRQALEKELADLRAGRQQPQPEAQTQDLIDPETDPIAALKQIRDFQQQQREQGVLVRQNAEFAERVQTHEADFAAATPDYGDAIAHLRESRAKEIMDVAKAIGQRFTQQQLAAQLRHEVLMTADVAFKAGKNPGEVFYELAKARGYALKEAAPPKVEAPPEPSKEAVETIDRITRGQRASKVAGGDAPEAGGEMTLERLAKLEGAAFDAGFAKFSAGQRNVH